MFWFVARMLAVCRSAYVSHSLRCLITRGALPGVVAAAFTVLAPTLHAESSRRPNIVIIYADDLGYGDVQCYNPKRGKIPTPHIDRLARQGMMFTDAHSSSAVCSPSRYTLLTGRYHWRTRLQKGIVGLWQPPLISPDRMTIGSLAKQHGYTTACIGKWHLGWDWAIRQDQRSYFRAPDNDQVDKRTQAVATEAHRAAWQTAFSKPIGGGPIAVGFDSYFGTDVPNWPPYCFIQHDRTIGIPSEFLPARLLRKNQASVQGPALPGWELEPILPSLGDRAVQCIARQSAASTPFLLYLSLTSPHTPLSVNPQWQGKSGLNLYADFVMETDAVVGRILAALDEAAVADHTLVVFTSDNGCAHYIGVKELEAQGHFPSGPLRGYKSDAWEGGHRVPFVVRWPAVVRPGSVSRQLVHQADLLATLADILSTPLPPGAGEDSFSLLPLLEGNDAPVRNHAVSCSIKGVPGIRLGSWKLIAGSGSGGWSKGGGRQQLQLYQLADDLSEANNLAADQPERVEKLKELMEELIRRGRSTPGVERQNDIHVVRHW